MRMFAAVAAFVCVMAGLAWAFPKPKAEELPAPRQLPRQSEIRNGHYRCKGDGYSILATVRKVGSVYAVSWHMEGRGILGAGLRSDDTLCVGYTTPQGAQGVAVYEIGADALRGSLAQVPGDAKLHEETLIWLAPLEEP